jgi:hypothetical protein
MQVELLFTQRNWIDHLRNLFISHEIVLSFGCFKDTKRNLRLILPKLYEIKVL